MKESIGPTCRCSKCNSLLKASPKATAKKPIRYRFNFMKHMDLRQSNYRTITSISYLTEKYGEKKAENIARFVRCIHKQINSGVNRISDLQASSILPWTRVRLFLLLVTLSQRGGSDYWMGKEGEMKEPARPSEPRERKPQDKSKPYGTLIEEIMRQNINDNYREADHDENYVFSSIWANFMEGLINHFLEKVIIPSSERKVCQQLYKPMMKIISLYNEYNELMEKSERNGFLPPNQEPPAIISSDEATSIEDGKLQTAQRLLWQARQDIPKTISKELTLLSEMYSTLSADEQDFELDEFVCSAEEYIELEYLPSLIEVLFANGGTLNFWKIMIVLEPFFYYIEEVADEESPCYDGDSAKPDPRVVTLEKICEVAAEQEWI
ncbi:Aan1p [Lachancea thermotolerans CBS 6340]|uniref:KLTH0B04378p n=1 Tax=Lachancea thermotolerans (strain ATCC 56472 / CBS 6340 / NRRL Y-8284) TaxID=559295 RepID=C5DCM8_LACTC|nr:KLTH0B04378p [Lachancea thermotolerans CBS 6340]CAR21539.1 KLTH0B04378p [Lachancea thermotolerans CBS 6340]